MKRITKPIVSLLVLMLILIFVPTSTVSAATKINKKKATIEVGATINLKITGTDSKVTWTTSNKKVAKVNSKGKVTGVSKGKATITAKVNKQTYKSTITVVDNKVKVIFNSFITDDTTIEDYVKELQKENPTYQYSVYDDVHYSMKVSKKEFKLLKKEMSKSIDTLLLDAINDPDLVDIVSSITIDEDYKGSTVTVDSEKIDEYSAFMVTLQVYLICDIGQSIELVKPADREYHITILDDKTQKILYKE